LRKAKSRADETQMLIANIAHTDVLIVLDERGKEFTSRGLAKNIANWRDDGQKRVYFAIGGADGFEPPVLPAGTIKWRLGSQTWPHKLVRVMITEQIYRGLAILAKTPYHRD
ncbi:MAG: 23S rRNA (pseudouridine(1915)-N(3))-methyltransferase RlmH, partial [Acidimicrobiales bacterium]